MNDEWRRVLTTLIDGLNRRYFTGGEFKQCLTEILSSPDCPLGGLRYVVDAAPPFAELSFGTSLLGNPDNQKTFPLGDTNRQCRIYQWLKQPSVGIPAVVNDLLEQLFNSFWKTSVRSASAGMPDLKRISRAVGLAQQTVEFHVSEGKQCALMFCDLDNFSPINKELGHPTGDRVIVEFGALLESRAHDSSILLHLGGDEFLFILPDTEPAEVTLLAYNLSRAVSVKDFQVDPHQMGVSFGIASTEEANAAPTYECLKERADNALNLYAKKPKRGKARFLFKEQFVQKERTLSQEIILAHCVAKSAASVEAPFGSVWLNCLSRIVVNALKEASEPTKVAIEVDTFLQWADLDQIPLDKSLASVVTRDGGIYISPSASAIDVAFAVIHGLLRWSCIFGHGRLGSPCIQLQYGDDGKHAKVNLSDGTPVWSSSLSDATPNCFDIGSLWSRSTDNLLPPTLARAILIQIGHHQPNLPLGLFLERIVVDDRPTRGGGLPDFWEATIARLIVQTVKHPSTGAVYVIGNHDHGMQTVEYLHKVSSWDKTDEQMAYKTGLPIGQIREAAKCLHGKIHFPAGDDQLLDHLSELLRSPYPFEELNHAVAISTVPFLRRELKLDKLALNREDGCRVNTIAEAYPVVLEIARKAGENGTITDQAGEKLRELIDFKVHLLTPSQNLIPSFYRGEERSFEAYYQNLFISPTGLFGKVFFETQQQEAVLAHLRGIMENPSRQFSTRRAILIVPHHARADLDLAPLGLVSIRIIPRFLGSRPNLSFSYTWRTVEAVKGFPYSLFGSVRFSQHLTEKLKERLSQEVARQVEFGTVSYIAHSLHFFLDDYGQNIARRIVDEASY